MMYVRLIIGSKQVRTFITIYFGEIRESLINVQSQNGDKKEQLNN